MSGEVFEPNIMSMHAPAPGRPARRAADPVLPLALAILGSCGVISMLLPCAAENYPLLSRGRLAHRARNST